MIILGSVIALSGLSKATSTPTTDKYKTSGTRLSIWSRMEFSLIRPNWELKMSTKMIILCSKSAPGCYFEVERLCMLEVHIYTASGYMVQYYLEILSLHFLFCTLSCNSLIKNGDHFWLISCSQFLVFKKKKQ